VDERPRRDGGRGRSPDPLTRPSNDLGLRAAPSRAFIGSVRNQANAFRKGGAMSRSIRSIRSAGIAIVATLFSSAIGAQSATAGDACSLLSNEDAAAALGEAAAGPKATGPMSDATGETVSVCAYTGSDIHSINLTLTRLPASSLPMYKAMCA